MKHSLIMNLVMLSIFGSTLLGCASSVETRSSGTSENRYGVVARLETQPAEYKPTLTLYRVSGEFMNVTSVKLKFRASPTEYSLQPLGSGTWQIRFSPEELTGLRKASAGLMLAELTVRSENSKRRDDVRMSELEIVGSDDLHALVPHGKAASL